MFYKKSFITLHALILPGVGRGDTRDILCAGVRWIKGLFAVILLCEIKTNLFQKGGRGDRSQDLSRIAHVAAELLIMGNSSDSSLDYFIPKRVSFGSKRRFSG